MIALTLAAGGQSLHHCVDTSVELRITRAILDHMTAVLGVSLPAPICISVGIRSLSV